MLERISLPQSILTLQNSHEKMIKSFQSYSPSESIERLSKDLKPLHSKINSIADKIKNDFKGIEVSIRKVTNVHQKLSLNRKTLLDTLLGKVKYRSDVKDNFSKKLNRPEPPIYLDESLKYHSPELKFICFFL